VKEGGRGGWEWVGLGRKEGEGGREVRGGWGKKGESAIFPSKTMVGKTLGQTPVKWEKGQFDQRGPRKEVNTREGGGNFRQTQRVCAHGLGLGHGRELFLMVEKLNQLSPERGEKGKVGPCPNKVEG